MLRQAQHERKIPNRKNKMDINKSDTAVVFIDPQNEVLSDKGLAWGAVGENVRENKTVENMERIFKAAKENGFEGFISPHYIFPSDRGWKFNGPLETDEADAYVRSQWKIESRRLLSIRRRLARSQYQRGIRPTRIRQGSLPHRISDPDQRDFSSDKTFWR
jgi:Isochorismatase family